MHIIVDRNEFKKMLSVASEICKTSNNLLTETILIKTNKQENKLTCLFFNYNMKIEYDIVDDTKFEIINDGVILTNFNLLNVIFTKLNDGNIDLELIDTVVLKITKDDFISNINCLDPSLFVEYKLDLNDNNPSFSLSVDLLKEVKNKLFQCCLVKEGSSKTTSLNETILSNICFNSKNDQNILNIYSTDSYRVALLSYDNFDKKIEVVLDQEFINFLISNFDQDIDFYESSNQIIVKGNNLLVSYKKNELNFPNVLNAMSEDGTVATATISAKKLFNAIDRGYFVVADEKLPSIDWIIQEDNLIINFKSINIGNVVETIKLDQINGQATKVLMNAKLLLPMLKVFSDHNIDIKWIFSKNQYRLLFNDNQNKNFKQLLLLLRY